MIQVAADTIKDEIKALKMILTSVSQEKETDGYDLLALFLMIKK